MAAAAFRTSKFRPRVFIFLESWRFCFLRESLASAVMRSFFRLSQRFEFNFLIWVISISIFFSWDIPVPSSRWRFLSISLLTICRPALMNIWYKVYLEIWCNITLFSCYLSQTLIFTLKMYYLFISLNNCTKNRKCLNEGMNDVTLFRIAPP